MALSQIYNALPTTPNLTNDVVVTTTPLTFFERLRDAFQTAFESFIAFLPQIVAALLIIILGWVIAVLLGQLVRKLLTLTRVDKALDRLGLKRIREDTGLKLTVAGFVGGLVKWFLIIVAVLAAADILRLAQISEFLRSVLSYFPNVIVAVVIVTIGVLVGNFVHKLVLGAGRAAKLPSVPAIATFARWAIVIFAALAALVQLQVAGALIQILFTGIIAMLAIAGGLAFGLGGKEHAKEILDQVKRSTMPGSNRPREPMVGE